MSILLTGSNGNQYIFEETINFGHGVFKGFDKKNQQKVAIQRVPITVLDKYCEIFIRCLGNEPNVLQEVGNSQYIVAIIDYSLTQKHLNIIMEYCDDGNLANLIMIKGGKFSEKEAVSYLGEIADGLYAMHKSGYMHRNLKLENIFLKDGHCKIGDFRFVTKQPKAEQPVGTIEYTAPEIFCCGDGNYYDKQVDIWALGIMFHEMLFGNRPYKGAETQMSDIIYNNPYKPPASPPISDESRELLQKMLKFEPSERITAEDIQKHPLLKSRIESGPLLYPINVGLTKEYVNRIFRKLENYRQCCGFFLKFAGSLGPYCAAEKGFAEKGFIFDDLHVFTYHLLKFGHSKFSFLYQYLETRECPKKLLKHVETEYWKDFLESHRFDKLKSDTKYGRDLTEKFFMRFRIVELGPYLNRAGRNPNELDTIYNDNIHADCTVGFIDKLLEAIGVLQKMSQTKKDALGDDLRKMLMDLEFLLLVEEYADAYEIEIDVDRYRIERDKPSNSSLDMKGLVNQRT